ncbi:MAG: phosphatidylglycerol lysyltransferase domain-containing protein [Candidatus Omnitrophica bacterium]|nr:phosphatidylglycerol lysyltransferase domain-containing protein [Candidatus Omnitrophota bacterium]
MRLNKLFLRDKNKFSSYLNLERHALAVYAFANIYIWRRFFDIRWAEIAGSLCVFFQDKIGSFLYIPPLGKTRDPQVVQENFKILERLNKNPEFAHIENIEEKDKGFYEGLGLECAFKSYDYLCRRTELAQLRGNKFKSKRSSCNFFTKRYDFSYAKLTLKERGSCFKLYNLWAQQRNLGNPDHIYQGMLSDSRVSLKEALVNYADLGFQGAVVKIDKEVKGFTFGFPLSPDTFCILYEITDLSVKGLAQFIFRSFAQELKSYKYINIMDDSGLENLKKVKLSYHPEKLVPAYIARRKPTSGTVLNSKQKCPH